jgi:hypothetical protein
MKNKHANANKASKSITHHLSLGGAGGGQIKRKCENHAVCFIFITSLTSEFLTSE